jgi:hypothetical protein
VHVIKVRKEREKWEETKWAFGKALLNYPSSNLYSVTSSLEINFKLYGKFH